MASIEPHLSRPVGPPAMSVAHPATIILTSLPTSILLGIDLLSLTPSTCFDGITSLPPGLHFVFSGASNSLSARTGYFFIVPLEPRSSSEAFLRIWKWSPELEELVPDYGPSLDQWRSHLSKSDHNSDDLSEGLFAYRQVAEPPSDGAASLEHGDWSRLTRHVSAGLLSRLTGSNADGGWVVGTTSCGAQDSEDIPGLERKWDRERELRLLEIDLKRSWRQDAIGEERTKGARAKTKRVSWMKVVGTVRGVGVRKSLESLNCASSWFSRWRIIHASKVGEGSWSWS